MIEKCPCGSNKSANSCCYAIISGKRKAKTPEQLMRSRYTAYTQANMDYIQKTMTGLALEGFDVEATKNWATSISWLGLEVIQSFFDEMLPTKGFVEFEVTYKNSTGNEQKICELSEFNQIGKIWYYTDGKISTKPLNPVYNKMSRNDPCSCGSGKKFKKCCY